MLARIAMMMPKAAPAWSPFALWPLGTEARAWYEPSLSNSTLFQDAAGTAPVTAVGQPVGLMLDKSGQGNHAAQVTASKRPLLQQDGGGKYYLDFDGLDDSMATGSINFTSTDKVAIVAGFLRRSTSLAVLLELSVNTNNNSAFVVFAPSAGSTINLTTCTGAGSYSSAQSVDAAAPSLGVFTFAADRALATNEASIRKNGALATSSRSENVNTSGNYANAPLFLGGRAGSSLFFNGALYGLIVVGAAPSAGEIVNAETYMNSKTGAF